MKERTFKTVQSITIDKLEAGFFVIECDGKTHTAATSITALEMIRKTLGLPADIEIPKAKPKSKRGRKPTKEPGFTEVPPEV